MSEFEMVCPFCSMTYDAGPAGAPHWFAMNGIFYDCRGVEI